MSEQIESGTPSAIVQLALREHAQQSALASIHIPKNRNSKVNKLLIYEIENANSIHS